jgi:hypothetical protein
VKEVLWYLQAATISLHLFLKLGVGLKAVELGRGNPILFSLSHLNTKTKSNSARSEMKTKTNLRDIKRLENKLIRSGTWTRSDYEKANRKHRPVEPSWAQQQHNHTTSQPHTTMHRQDNQPIRCKIHNTITKSNNKIHHTNCIIEIKRWIIKKMQSANTRFLAQPVHPILSQSHHFISSSAQHWPSSFRNPGQP